MLPRLAATLALTIFLSSSAVSELFAQNTALADQETVAPAHVALVDGVASLEREGRSESPLNMPLLSGDRLKTADGRVEVLFADGSTLHLDRSTTIDVQSDDLIRLTDGRVRLNIPGTSRTITYRIDSPSGSVRISEAGEYRVSILHGTEETQLELAVLRGSGEIFTDQGTTPVRAGERAYASAGLAPSYAYAYNSANMDAFDRWSEERRDTRLGVSTQYLPSDMQQYASTFDQNGAWQYSQPYGYVWYPRVAAGWRPYYYGRWMPYPSYGWTWVSADHFGWPTHHYGRWGFSGGSWFWIPGNHWGPAWVSWGYSNNFVSWCPLGFNNFPVVSISVFNSYLPRFHGLNPYYPAWTVMSRSHFGHGWVNDRAVNWERWNGARPAFTATRAVPIAPNVAVPRGSVPLHWAGTRAPAEGSRAALDRGAATASGSRARWLPPSGGRSSTGDRTAAPPRDTAVPRYVNRGDQIIRSQTERPSPAPGEFAGRTRVDSALPGERTGRTRVDPISPSTVAGQAVGRTRAGVVPGDTPGGNRGGVDAPEAAVPRYGIGGRTMPQGPARRSDEPVQIDRGPQGRRAWSAPPGPSEAGVNRRVEGPAPSEAAPSRRVEGRNIPETRSGPEPRGSDGGSMAAPRSPYGGVRTYERPRAVEPSGAREPGSMGGPGRAIDRGSAAQPRQGSPAAAPAPAPAQHAPSGGAGSAASRRGGRGGQ